MEKLLAKLDQINFSNIDVEELLDNRDEEAFDSEWMRVYREIEMLKKEKNYSADDARYVSCASWKLDITFARVSAFESWNS